MKINIGGGFVKEPDYINIDYDSNCNPDYVLNLEKDVLPFEDNTIEEVEARHILEHLGDGYFHCLKELYRVCKDGAIINITVPHHRHEYFLNDPTHKRPITVAGLQLFSKKYNDFCKSVDDGASKLGYFFDVDFEVIWYDYKYDHRYIPMYNAACADPELRPRWDQLVSENNNVIVETFVKLMVIK